MNRCLKGFQELLKRTRIRVWIRICSGMLKFSFFYGFRGEVTNPAITAVRVLIVRPPIPVFKL